jgi:hypothetical protein
VEKLPAGTIIFDYGRRVYDAANATTAGLTEAHFSLLFTAELPVSWNGNHNFFVFEVCHKKTAGPL